MTESAELPSMPFEQSCLLRPAPVLQALQERGPIHRVRTPVGDEAWLVTGYEQIRSLYGGDLVSRAHPRPERAARLTASALFGGRPQENFDRDDADRDGFNELLRHTVISSAQLRELRPWVNALVTTLLDELAAAPRPADFVDMVAVPLPTLVICKLLGVPEENLARYRELAAAIAASMDEQRSKTSLDELIGHLSELVAEGRAAPDGFLSRMHAAPYFVPPDGVAQMGAALMFTGHHTIIVAIGFAMLLLLTNPEQLRALQEDPTKLSDAVEECVRVGNVGVNIGGGQGFPTYARQDFDLAGVRIRAGELVLLDLGSANHDGQVFDDAYRFDIGRPANPHLTFGYGRRYCPGAGLARLEMQALFAQLIPRFPAMRLATGIENLRGHDDQITGGLVALPVTW